MGVQGQKVAPFSMLYHRLLHITTLSHTGEQAMTNIEIRDFIKDNLLIKYKVNWGLNSILLRKDWFFKHGYGEHYKYILNTTKFLPQTCSMGERIYSVFYDVHKIPLCFCCGAELKFKNFVDGYRISCGSHSCNLFVKANYVDKSGMTPNQRGGLEVSRKLNAILEDGKTIAQHRGELSAKTRTTTILDNGLTIAQDASNRGAATKMNTFLPNGLSIAQDASIRAAETMENIITGSLGESIKEFRIRKGTETKSVVGDDGIDVYERAFLNGAGRNCPTEYHESGLYYQGSYEKDFLDMATRVGIVEHIFRGPRIKYKMGDGRVVRQYRSDFLLNGRIFEMKSTWSYDEAGKNPSKRLKTNLKIKAATEQGFEVVLVVDRVMYRTFSFVDFYNFDCTVDTLLSDSGEYKSFDEDVLFKLSRNQ